MTVHYKRKKLRTLFNLFIYLIYVNKKLRYKIHESFMWVKVKLHT